MPREDDDNIILSICIPTYNRLQRIIRLIVEMLSFKGDFEICVHVDGSSDGTMEALQELRDPRLRLSFGPNQGRSSAVLAAVRKARGKFTMIFDDDDDLYLHVLKSAIERCQNLRAQDIAGFIYHMDDVKGKRIGTQFVCDRSNFVRLRADEKVRGDKKEIVRTSLLRLHAYESNGTYRRTPSSLNWTRIALSHDVICINESIGVKRYLHGGITSEIRAIKLQNAYPMFLLHHVRCAAFMRHRYSNFSYFIRSTLAMMIYGMLSLKDFKLR